jgi:hypothetical protein
METQEEHTKQVVEYTKEFVGKLKEGVPEDSKVLLKELLRALCDVKPVVRYTSIHFFLEAIIPFWHHPERQKHLPSATAGLEYIGSFLLVLGYVMERNPPVGQLTDSDTIKAAQKMEASYVKALKLGMQLYLEALDNEEYYAATECFAKCVPPSQAFLGPSQRARE